MQEPGEEVQAPQEIEHTVHRLPKLLPVRIRPTILLLSYNIFIVE